MHVGYSLGFALCLAAPAVAQIKLPPPLAGKYTVDPQGKGARTFVDLSTAVRYVALIGVSGDLTIEVKPGEYEGQLTFFPVPGLKEDQKVVFKGVGQGPVLLKSDNGIVHLNDGCKNIVFDGLVFGASGQSATISATGKCTDIEIRNCRFTKETGSDKVIEVQGRSGSRRWHIHHNAFDLGSGLRHGIYTQGAYKMNVYANEFICNDNREPISFWNSNKSESRVYDNVFRGSLRGCCMRLDVSGHDVDIFNNLFLLRLGRSQVVIQSQGLRGAAYNKIRHNLFVLPGDGSAIKTRGPIALSHNTYAIDDGAVGIAGTAEQETLQDWQEALESFAVSDQKDQGSAVADKRLFTKHKRLLAMFHRFDANEKVDPKADPEEEVRYLIGLLKSDDPVVLRLAIRRLVTHGKKAVPAVPSLGRLCGHAHVPIAADAVEALRKIRIGAEIVIPELIKLLARKDERVLLATLRTLQGFAHLAGQAVPALERLKKHELESVRGAAAATLATVSGKPAKRGD